MGPEKASESLSQSVLILKSLSSWESRICCGHWLHGDNIPFFFCEDMSNENVKIAISHV